MSDRANLLQRAMAREELNRREIVRKCREVIISHERGVMWWLRNWTATENKHWKEQGRQPVAPFPYVPYPAKFWDQGKLDALREWFPHELRVEDPPDYIDVVMGFLLTQKRLNIPKSREMMTSWTVCGYITWQCIFFPQIEWMSQSEDDRKAQALIEYSNALFKYQPDWLRERLPLKRGKEATLHEIEWMHGSKYTALPSGPRKLAYAHPTGYFNDESAHQPEYMETLSVVSSVAKQIVCVSSSAPGAFGDECEMPNQVSA